MISEQQRIITGIILGFFIASQFFTISAVLLAPKPAQAVFGALDTNYILGDLPAWLQKLITGVLRELALRISEKYIARFVDKLQEKYKIKNFLYYDRVLSNYYLNRYIFDKVSDPDLRQIYSMMESAYVSGTSTGTTGQPDPRRALIPRLNKAISDLYIKKGGIDPNKVYNPSPSVSEYDYFQTSYVYFLNPIGYAERNLQAEFGKFQSSATTAAQLEIMIGSGLKAGRVIGGTCKVGGVTQPSGSGLDTPEKCKEFGGTWQPSALDEARSFIDNPTVFIQGHLDSFIKEKVTANFNPNNFWSVIGSLVGNFLWNKFALAKPGGTLEEAPAAFAYGPEGGTQLDIDNDGIPDGYDIDDDGSLDICHHGGTAPNCTPSGTATSSPYFVPMCQSLEFAIKELKKYLDWLTRTPFVQAQSVTWLNRTSVVNGAADDLQTTLIQYEQTEYDTATVALGKYTKFMGKIINSLAKDDDLKGFWGSDAEAQAKIIVNTTNLLAYLQEFKIAVNRCDNPDAAAAALVPPPVIDPGDNPCLVTVLAGTDNSVYRTAGDAAIAQALNDNPVEAATLATLDPGGGVVFIAAAASIIDAAALILRAQGYRVGRALDCDGNISTNKIILGSFGDQNGKIYSVFSSVITVGLSLTQHFSGLTYTEDGGWERLVP
ncbi:MAG: hypothetical protein A3B10_04155 [Candidatus Doudnabacteria bacterium RIFCSPLOWO2_01_FULL_44_21]|uniref:Uncharacterized protein n=1 Tax=Candidatus Doudnabacteria bacterium RIFCSPLOWO2_01_FULL_44_21 TaxID=1817841 RepID=A0A1F5Q577_9BACT|nr:MAG: hypothetical protein A3B95_00385 [Candidatus Doudnabacteria bacterium RIFCSPHIGHO2_02_FULL_43_13b]OGE97308.1 MAG: hypothetical protein A3B10_04155 [Candidatus Doudnabacteria bacterium RIFCSPLOWO2_01_FULL_44_21]